MALLAMSSRIPASLHEPDAEAMPREQLRACQLERLRRMLDYAYRHVAWYREAFDRAGVTPAALRGWDDLRRFPFTDKRDLRQAYPFGMLAVPREQVVRLHASSGTTSKPTVVGYTSGDIETWTDLMARSLVCAGVRPGDILHNAYNYGLFTGGFGVHYGAERLGCSVTPVSSGNTERQVMILRDFGAHVLAATPSYALNIAETARAMGHDLAAGPLRVGLFGGEPSSPALRRRLERELGLNVRQLYGLSEVMGPGVAAECAEQRGLHAWEDHFLLEVVDPRTLAPLPPGEPGELVITTLTKEAQPVIRYRTRDITRLSDAPCRCGRSHQRILGIDGRDDDMLIIRGVNLYPSQLEDVLVDIEGLRPHYRLIVRREGTLDELTVEIECAAGAGLQRVARAARERIKTMIGVSCEVRLLEHGSLPRSEGKAVRVKDLREAVV